jgi:O-antigen/teichoic acid export membrane protein
VGLTKRELVNSLCGEYSYLKHIVFLKNKSNIAQAFWVGIGSFSSFTLSIVTAAILSRFLSKTEYGTYKQILYVYNTLLIIFSAGLPRVFNYYLPRYNLSKGKEIVSKITRILFAAGLLFSLSLFLLSGVIADVLKNPELSIGLKWFSPVPMLLLPTLGLERIFASYRKTTYIAVYNTITRVLMLAFIVLPVILYSNNYLSAIYGWIIVSVIVLLLANAFKKIPFKNVEKQESGLEFKEILKYSIPLVFASVAGTIYRSANQFYISRYFGAEVFAEFSNGFVEIPFVHMITGSASAVLMPMFSKLIHDKSDIDVVTNLWRRTIQKSAILIYPIVIFFLFYSREVITLVYSQAYSTSAVYFSIAMVLNFFNIIIFAPLLLSLGETKFYARLHIFQAIAVWVSHYVVMVIFNSPVSIAISFIVIAISGIIVSLFFSAGKLGVSFKSLFPVGRLIIIGIHSFISLLLVQLIFENFTIKGHQFLVLVLVGVGYTTTLILSAKWFRINYWEIVKPLLIRVNK